MKQKELKDLRAKNAKELSKALSDLEKDLITKKLDLKMNKLKNVHLASNVKKNIAVVKTLIVEKTGKAEAASQKGKNGTS